VGLASYRYDFGGSYHRCLRVPELFLNHATEDKVPFVRELANALSRSYLVWYDEYSIPPGGSIFQSISVGLANCDFGVVILSSAFFTKKWTQAELGGLFARESAIMRRIIPVWKDVSFEEVRAFSPILADRRAAKASDGVEAVVSFISRAIDMAEKPDGFVHTATVATRFSDLSDKLHSVQNSRSMLDSAEGARLIIEAQNVLFDLVERQTVRLATEAPKFGLRHRRAELHCFPADVAQLTIEGPGGLTLDFEAVRPHRNSGIGATCNVAVFRHNRDRLGSGRKPTFLEDHRFTPEFTSREVVAWKDAGGTIYQQQELCDFAFQRFYEHIERWCQEATKS
jgi:TIR domain